MSFVDTLNALTNEAVQKKVIDNIFNATPTLKEFKSKQETGYAGTKLQIPVEYALNSNRGWYRGSDTFLTNNVETATHLEFEWVDSYVSIVITGDDKDKNQGKEAIVNLLNHKLNNGRKSMSYLLTSGIFADGTGTGNKEMTGLKSAVDDGTNIATYGGLARGTYTWNKAKYTSLGDYISWPAMQSMYGDLTDGEEKPQLIITTQDVWDDLWELATPTIRSDSNKSSIDYGFEHIKFNSAKIIVDAQTPTGQMFFLNQTYLKLHPLKGYESPKWTGWKEPLNQDVAVGQFIWKGQLACSNCRYQGRIVSITT
jgi:hypothetical protein